MGADIKINLDIQVDDYRPPGYTARWLAAERFGVPRPAGLLEGNAGANDMMISRTSEYALRAMLWLGGHREAALGTAEIAKATRVPEGYLSKVLQGLSRARLVRSRPGRTGGFELSRPPETITVLDVIAAVDGIERIDGCPLGLHAHRGKLCPLHRRLESAMELMRQALAQSTIAELLTEAPPQQPWCEVVPPPSGAAGRGKSNARRRGRRRRPAGQPARNEPYTVPGRSPA